MTFSNESRTFSKDFPILCIICKCMCIYLAACPAAPFNTSKTKSFCLYAAAGLVWKSRCFSLNTFKANLQVKQAENRFIYLFVLKRAR